MNRVSKTVIFCIAFFLLFGCTENTKKLSKANEETTKWKFVKMISLDTISPIGIVAQDDFLWISDVENNRVVKIDLNGKIIESFDGFKRPMHLAIQGNTIFIPEYSTDTLKTLQNGTVSIFSIKEKPDAIGGVAVEGTTIALADFYNNRIILQQGNETTIIGKKGHADGELYYPTDIEIKNSLIYVADAYNNRVQVFDFDGNYIKMIGWNEGIKVATGLKVTENQVFIADFDGNRVLMYDFDGELLQILKDNFNRPMDIEIIKNKLFVVNYKGKSISVFEK